MQDLQCSPDTDVGHGAAATRLLVISDARGSGGAQSANMDTRSPADGANDDSASADLNGVCLMDLYKRLETMLERDTWYCVSENPGSFALGSGRQLCTAIQAQQDGLYLAIKRLRESSYPYLHRHTSGKTTAPRGGHGEPVMWLALSTSGIKPPFTTDLLLRDLAAKAQKRVAPGVGTGTRSAALEPVHEPAVRSLPKRSRMGPRAPTAASIDLGVLGGSKSTHKLHERNTTKRARLSECAVMFMRVHVRNSECDSTQEDLVEIFVLQLKHMGLLHQMRVRLSGEGTHVYTEDELISRALKLGHSWTKTEQDVNCCGRSMARSACPVSKTLKGGTRLK